MKPDTIVDTGTQTSPALSRSSSFTWVSTSSLLLHTDDDDDNRSTSSSSCSPQRSSSRDSLSDSPLGSVERDEPESGIGTASPPRSNKCAGRKSWCFSVRVQLTSANAFSVGRCTVVQAKYANEYFSLKRKSLQCHCA
jgi:hypothetical protein